MKVYKQITVLLVLSFMSVPLLAQAEGSFFDGSGTAPEYTAAALKSVDFTAAAVPPPSRAQGAMSWKGNLCGNAGCSLWYSDTGTTWRGDQCGNSGCWSWRSYEGKTWSCPNGSFSNAGCRLWKSETNATWTCVANPYGNAGCDKWSSNTGVLWSCETNHFSNAGCNSWKSSTGLAWRGALNACGNAGCSAWNADAPDDTFLPFFVQSWYEYFN